MSNPITAIVYCDQPEFSVRLDRLGPGARAGTLVIEDATDRAEITLDTKAAARIVAALRPLSEASP